VFVRLPYGQFRPAAEVTTGTDGYASTRFIPTPNLHTAATARSSSSGRASGNSEVSEPDQICTKLVDI
jgi:hypothetical protein